MQPDIEDYLALFWSHTLIEGKSSELLSGQIGRGGGSLETRAVA